MRLMLVLLVCAGVFSQEIGAALKEELQASLRSQNPGKSADKTDPDLFIFISLGMPDELLLTLASDAEKAGALMVLRGLPNNSFNDFGKRLLQLKKKGLSATIQIHPVLFQEYSVAGVPAFVLKDEKSFEKVSGNISVEYVLQLFEEGGSSKAKEILAKFRDNKNV
jgi:conjugal transfer pilus assembly protein TrbC